MNETDLRNIQTQSVQAAEEDMERQISEYCQKNMGTCTNNCPKCIAHLLAHKGFRRNKYVEDYTVQATYGGDVSQDELTKAIEKLLSDGSLKAIL